jgi:O-antigen ligase
VTPRAHASVDAAGRAEGSAIAAFADTAAFSVVVSATVAIPLVFSIATPDVFALPKTVLAVAIAALLTALLVVRWWALGRPLPSPSSLAIALGAFVAWNVLAAWLAVDRWHALAGEQYQHQGLAAILAYVVFFTAAWTTLRGDLRQTIFLIAVTTGAVVVATYALVQRAGLDPIWSTLPEDRVFSTMGHATALAAYLVLTVPFVAALVIGPRGAWRAAAIVALLLIVAALAFTLSRGGFLGLAVAGVVFGIATWLGRRRAMPGRRGLAVTALIGVVAVVTIMSIPPIRAVAERVAARALLTADLGEGSTRMHLDQWAVGAAIVAEHPLFGTGQDTYVLVFDGYRDRILDRDRAAVLSQFRPESPHNVYLAIAGGAGIPALGAYLAVIGLGAAGVLVALRSEASTPLARLFATACLAAIVGHLVTDTFVTAETTSSVLFWTVLGAGVAASESAR